MKDALKIICKSNIYLYRILTNAEKYIYPIQT